ncbi:hypothetical protein NGTWS0302_36800 [Mycolicibacterium cyprinidarum]|uniref:Lipoprotein LpqS n=1 Tax=Mycolicibacterium cyprinidarum TaxID=2860311 RepID=A0ABQ4V8T9_9MYCO|nr:hypothetical protein NGTWS1702_38400 [Mycolicibacterium sp. NGTWSNA01]GJF12051.1 hypothetical protein NGTWS1803_21330 [Mycolicibacterium sp. NGTWS1803]GJF14639.1 hypothetical protein NGTWS0302_36800 [Mycolicibacterium sp. NGTWS0302]
MCRGAVTSPHQLRGGHGTLKGAATVGCIVSHNDHFASPGLRSAVALVVACWVVVASAQWGLPGLGGLAEHGPHALASAAPGPPGHEAVVVDHAHVGMPSSGLVPDTFAEAVLPRAGTALTALALIAAVGAATLLWRSTYLAAARGPPRIAAQPLFGRSLLARLCVARR